MGAGRIVAGEARRAGAEEQVHGFSLLCPLTSSQPSAIPPASQEAGTPSDIFHYCHPASQGTEQDREGLKAERSGRGMWNRDSVLGQGP